jgi:hypothetical protein
MESTATSTGWLRSANPITRCTKDSGASLRFQLISQAAGWWVWLHRAHFAVAEALQHLGNQLLTVVHPEHHQRPAGRGEHPLKLGDEPLV